jgi:glycosyltransferase involved in cell wall biosynthesis
MKTLLLNTYDLDGGAARAAYRLHSGLKSINVNSIMMVQNKSSDDSTVISRNLKKEKIINKLRPHIDKLPIGVYQNRSKVTWSVNWLANNSIIKEVNNINPDIVHLHWINDGFLPITFLKKIKKPIVWTLHDMWPFTGGCHYNNGCEKFKTMCGQCPQLNSKNFNDLSNLVWERKLKYWKDLDFTIITPSNWLANEAKESSLFINKKVKVIPNGIDTNIYKPIDKMAARKILNLSLEKKYILFGAMGATSDPRKGFKYLNEALQVLKTKIDLNDVELMIFGSSGNQDTKDIGYKTNFLGKVVDDVTLSLIYNACDVFIAPSQQDNLPNTVLEAISTGTPCVAFNIGGMSDLVMHKVTGYLANPFDISDLSKGIEWILHSNIGDEIKVKNRKFVEKNYGLKVIAEKHKELYESLINNSNKLVSL